VPYVVGASERNCSLCAGWRTALRLPASRAWSDPAVDVGGYESPALWPGIASISLVCDVHDDDVGRGQHDASVARLVSPGAFNVSVTQDAGSAPSFLNLSQPNQCSDVFNGDGVELRRGHLYRGRWQASARSCVADSLKARGGGRVAVTTRRVARSPSLPGR
jgi:hypothetical protein